MKKMIKNIYILLAVLSLTGCEDFLDSTMKSEYSSDNFFSSQENAEKALTGVYNSLYGMKWWVFGDVASDDAVKGGNAGDQADINAIDDFSANSDNGIISEFWKSTYETIAQANNVIAYVTPMNFDATAKNRIVGEAKFLRAFSYFQLVNIFGAVPYKDQPQTTDAAIHVPLSSVDVIYSKIEQDLKEAAVALQTPASEKGHATQGAALALLAKVYLFQQKYADCLAQITALEGLDLYDLEQNYADLFKRGAEDSKEVIFGLRFANDEIASLGNAFNVWLAPSIEGGYYFDAPTQAYVDCFTEQTKEGAVDPRLDASIGRDGQPWFNGTTFQASWSEATGYLVKKYNEDLPEDEAKSQSTIPYHYLRYAEVLLMKAEAINEGVLRGENSVKDAAAALDEVRDRAGLDVTAADTQVALRDAIRVERRRELGFEFHRFYDVMRYGKDYAESVLGESFKGKWGANRFYYPLPQAELDANQAL